MRICADKKKPRLNRCAKYKYSFNQSRSCILYVVFDCKSLTYNRFQTGGENFYACHWTIALHKATLTVREERKEDWLYLIKKNTRVICSLKSVTAPWQLVEVSIFKTIMYLLLYRITGCFSCSEFLRIYWQNHCFQFACVNLLRILIYSIMI